MDWRQLSSADREREYSPSTCIGGNYQPFIAAYARQSADALAKTTAYGAHWSRHQYGSQATQSLRLCVPPRSDKHTKHQLTDTSLPPLLVFIHGGYWQELSATDSLFPASSCVAQGAAFAALDYTLAPHATLEQICKECIQAVQYLQDNSTALGFDASRIVLAGSSAGAHLAAMVAQSQSSNHLCGVVLVSGIYELEPLIGTSINAALGLSANQAQALSPSLISCKDFPQAVVCYGAVETDQFKQQSLAFANQLRAQSALNTKLEAFEVPQRNHFDVIMDLTDTNTRLGQATFNLLSRIETY